MPSRTLPPAPVAIDNTVNMSADFGMMLNDELGDCTCAAIFHALQVWSFNAGKTEKTYSDANVQALYESACGYDPKDPSTDQGGVEQDMLAYLVSNGIPIGDADHPWQEVDKIISFLEVDFRNLDDVKRVIADFGVLYIGVNLPQSVMDNIDDSTKPWDVGGDETIAGGHAVILVGYEIDENGQYIFTCLSWGQRFKVTVAFLGAFMDEAYAIVANDWLNVSGVTPLGMSKQELLTILPKLRQPA